MPEAELDYSQPVPLKPDPTHIVLRANLGAPALGSAGECEIAALSGAPRFTNGLEDGRVAIFVEAGKRRSLRAKYPKGTVGRLTGGARWPCARGASYESLARSYELRFADGFDFVLGGRHVDFASFCVTSGRV